MWGVGVVGSRRMSCAPRRSYDTVRFQHFLLYVTHLSFLLHCAHCCCMSPIFHLCCIVHVFDPCDPLFHCCCTLSLNLAHFSCLLHRAYFCSMWSMFIFSAQLPISHFCGIVYMFVALCAFVFCVTHVSFIHSFRRADPKKHIDDGCSAPPLCCL